MLAAVDLLCRHHIKLLVFTALFLPLLIGLGIWQWHRAAEKQAWLDQQALPAQSVTAAALSDWPVRPGQTLQVMGRYDPRYLWLLDNRTRHGRAGYEVLQVFWVDAAQQNRSGQTQPLLINRGWLAAPTDRKQLPAIPQVTGQWLALTVHVAAYPVPPVLAKTAVAPQDWPRRVQQLDRRTAAASIIRPAAAGPVEIASFTGRLADPAQAGALALGWTQQMMGPETHYAYAAQWFGLALALLILTIFMLLKAPE